MTTIRLGSQGADVKTWQTFLHLEPDSHFGPVTEAATVAWQTARQLDPDGVVGPATWAVAFPRDPVLPPPGSDIHVRAKAATDALPLTPAEGLFVRCVGWHETNLGSGWGPTPPPNGGHGSFNMGAITTGGAHGPLDFEHKDSRNDTGKVIVYTTWFKGWPTFEAGIQGLAEFIFREGPGRASVEAAIAADGFHGGVAAMYANHYYLGVHQRNTPEGNAANVADYFKAVMGARVTICAHTGERMPTTPAV